MHGYVDIYWDFWLYFYQSTYCSVLYVVHIMAWTLGLGIIRSLRKHLPHKDQQAQLRAPMNEFILSFIPRKKLSSSL